MMDDYISRAAAIDEVNPETVSTNPEHFKSSEKFIKFMNDADIASFGKWQWANGFNTALVATTIQLKQLPSADVQPVVHGEWIDTGSGQECSVCGEIQYGYDSGRYYCANCGAKMKVESDVGKSD